MTSNTQTLTARESPRRQSSGLDELVLYCLSCQKPVITTPAKIKGCYRSIVDFEKGAGCGSPAASVEHSMVNFR